MKNCFCLSESYNGEHIGVVVASTTVELNEKIKEAIESHFDCEMLPLTDERVSFDNILNMYGMPLEFEVYLKDDPIPVAIGILKSYVY